MDLVLLRKAETRRALARARIATFGAIEQAREMLPSNIDVGGPSRVIPASEFERVGDAEWDHFFSRNNARPTATWLICKSCHLRITNDTNARAEATSAFTVYQNSIRVYLGSRQIPLGY